MAKKDKLPETVFVRREFDGGDSYLLANEDAATLIDEDGDAVVVGTYVLEDTRRLRKEAVVVEDDDR